MMVGRIARARATARAACKLRDEHGITTVSMAVSIFLSVALIFASAQVYRVSSASADIQEVADAAALAAESEVAEFMVAANTCDAAVLSMTLLSGVLYGTGVVCACIPPLAELSAGAIQLATKTVEARDRFAESASTGLEQLQRMLPFLAAAHAAAVAKANDVTGTGQASYFGAAVLLPASGEPLTVASDDLAGAGVAVEAQADDLRAQAAEAEERAKKAQEAKQRGFMADCGAHPGSCMYERADHLAGLLPVSNPLYESVDAWSFKEALGRAKRYFSARYENEDYHAAAGHDESIADSVLRMYYFDYASEETAAAYAAADGDRCTFPKLFRNLDEMRATPLYADQLFPVTDGEDGATVHAWSGCANAAGASHAVSIQQMEDGSFGECDRCHFTVVSFANVASATTNVPTGFEHHYQKVREACEEYNEAMDGLEPLKDQVKGAAQRLLDQLGEALALCGSQRIHAKPPGRQGAIALVVNTSSSSSAAGFESAFIGSGSTLGTRAAVSGASLLGDSSESGSSVITSLLDGFDADAGGAVGAGRVALDCWSSLLRAFEDGQAALTDGVARALNGIPTVTASGLGDWAADALGAVFAAVGLEPVQLDALKPVLVNTAHVAAGDAGQLAVRYRQIQAGALSASSVATDPFSALVASARGQMEAAGATGGSVTVAEMEFPAGDSAIPISIALPHGADDGGSFVDGCMDALAGAAASVTGTRSWR